MIFMVGFVMSQKKIIAINIIISGGICNMLRKKVVVVF